MMKSCSLFNTFNRCSTVKKCNTWARYVYRKVNSHYALLAEYLANKSWHMIWKSFTLLLQWPVNIPILYFSDRGVISLEMGSRQTPVFKHPSTASRVPFRTILTMVTVLSNTPPYRPTAWNKLLYLSPYRLNHPSFEEPSRSHVTHWTADFQLVGRARGLDLCLWWRGVGDEPWSSHGNLCGLEQAAGNQGPWEECLAKWVEFGRGWDFRIGKGKMGWEREREIERYGREETHRLESHGTYVELM